MSGWSGRSGLLFLVLALLPACAASTAPTSPTASTAPARARVFALDPNALAESKRRLGRNDAALRPAYHRLLQAADSLLAGPLISVTHKSTLLPPSGDKHDYFSLSPYWWPDPSKPDGLPYIRRDGETNPESKRDLDQPRVAAMGYKVHTLALAYYFSGKDQYARRAAEQLRYWFLDPATRMNPHLRFAQLVRGNPNERGSGIIDTRWFIEAIDAAGLIGSSPLWSAADQRALQDWFRAYLSWLRTTANGRHENAARNNHGSWYAAQVGSYALFVGDTATARAVIDSAKVRIAAQITAQGEMPEEMARTRSLHYHSFNIEALSRVAEMGRHLGIDVWNYQAPSGGSIKRALDRMAPFVLDPRAWPGTQLNDVELPLMIISLRRGACTYQDARYLELLRQLPERLTRTDRSILLYPCN